MPFDRLVRAVDAWATLRGRQDVFAQTGESDYQPKAIECVAMLPPDEFMQRVEQASLVVAHAGIGSIFAAMQMQRTDRGDAAKSVACARRAMSTRPRRCGIFASVVLRSPRMKSSWRSGWIARRMFRLARRCRRRRRGSCWGRCGGG